MRLIVDIMLGKGGRDYGMVALGGMLQSFETVRHRRDVVDSSKRQKTDRCVLIVC